MNWIEPHSQLFGEVIGSCKTCWELTWCSTYNPWVRFKLKQAINLIDWNILFEKSYN